jgi:hypothetical protein
MASNTAVQESHLTHWYQCDIDRGLLKKLSRRSNCHGLAYLAYFCALLGITAALALASVGTLFSIPAFFFYGSIWVFALGAW